MEILGLRGGCDLLDRGCAVPQPGAAHLWFAASFPMRRVCAWIRALPPYPTLALFSVPVILLEPVKMVAAYMAATGQVLWAAATFVVGEILKLVLIERLFELTKTTLMKVPAFAWAFNRYSRARTWVRETVAWKVVRALSLSLRDHCRQWRHSASRHHAFRNKIVTSRRFAHNQMDC